jgi:hypothetical protein
MGDMHDPDDCAFVVQRGDIRDADRRLSTIDRVSPYLADGRDEDPAGGRRKEVELRLP